MELMDLIVAEMQRRDSFDNDLKKEGGHIDMFNCLTLSDDKFLDLMLDANTTIVGTYKDATKEIKTIAYKDKMYYVSKEYKK